MASISLNSVVKRFGTNVTLHNVDLEVEDGEFTVFVGPSGCVPRVVNDIENHDRLDL